MVREYEYRCPSDRLMAQMDLAINVEKRLLGGGSQAKAFDLGVAIRLPGYDTAIECALKQYLVPYEQDSCAEEDEDEDDDDDKDDDEDDAAAPSPNPYLIERSTFEHEVFVLWNLTQLYRKQTSLPWYLYPFPIFFGASDDMENEVTGMLEQSVYMERCAGDLQHLHRVLPPQEMYRREEALQQPTGTILRTLVLHVLWALHHWRMLGRTCMIVHGDVKPDNIFLRKVDASIKEIRLPLDEHRSLVLPNIGYFAVIADYGVCTLYAKATDSEDAQWTRHVADGQVKYGILRLEEDVEKQAGDDHHEAPNASARYEDWGIHPELVSANPHENSYDLDFFLNLVTRMVTTNCFAMPESEGGGTPAELVAWAAALRGVIEPDAMFSNEGGYFELQNGSTDFDKHLQLGETIEGREGLYPLRKRDVYNERDPYFMSGIERPIQVSGKSALEVIECVYAETIRLDVDNHQQPATQKPQYDSNKPVWKASRLWANYSQ